jgi:hypothetical protein
MDPQEQYKQQIAYLKNIGNRAAIAWFDDDWEPIGPNLRKEMTDAGIIEDAEGYDGYICLPNVKEHAPPLATPHAETGGEE